ncbi:MAG: DUF1549 domain-containing protein [Acidobacteria bacterium]|nr:DUF1549 domain-containing protein [Acidobacteriota bacterium]
MTRCFASFVLFSTALLAADDNDTPTWRRMELRAPALPESSATHPVDRLLGAYFRSKQVTAAGSVTDAQFARRAYLDLWGLLPTPEQLAAFSADANPRKREALVDILLADGPRYADHWISFWNDHLRNDEGVVYHGERKSITPWLRPALEANLAYDKFLQALLNPASKSDPDGFLIGVNWRGDINASQTPEMQAAQNTAQVFMGINLKCNSCHDSFISRWKLKDAYGLATYFSAKPLEIHRCDAPTGQAAEAKFLYPELGGVAADAPLEVKRAETAKLFTKAENGRMPRVLVNRMWKMFFGRGITEPVDDMDARPWSPELLDWLAADFAANGYDLRKLMRRIMTSDAYAMQAWRDAESKPYVFRGPVPRRLSGEQFTDAIASITGEWRRLDPRQPGPATYARDWQIKSTALGRALGRPIRDQVITERVTAPTTLQALELVNGSTLATLLHRGAQRMLGELKPAPAPLFDSGQVTPGTKELIAADVDVAGRKKLWLVVQDVDSYDPARTEALWTETNLPGGRERIASGASSTNVLDVSGLDRFRAKVGLAESSKASDVNPRVRFFVFGEEPDPKQYLAVKGAPPVAVPPVLRNADALIDRVYRHALSRTPSAAERRAARAFGVTKPDGLEDLLWAVAMSPEFQYI